MSDSGSSYTTLPDYPSVAAEAAQALRLRKERSAVKSKKVETSSDSSQDDDMPHGALSKTYVSLSNLM